MTSARDLTIFWRTVIGRAYPRLIGLQREKSWLFFEILLPLLQVAAFVYIYRAIEAPEEFVGFAVLGGAMTAYWMNVLWAMASQLYWEKESGNLALYVIAPTSRMAILLGMAVGGVLSTTVRAGVVIFVGSTLFGVTFSLARWPEIAAVFLLTMVALYGMGMLFASLYLLWGREAWHLSHLMEEPVYLVSGFYFPARSLGFWVGIGASIIPITFGLDAMRQLLFPAMVTLRLLPVGWELLGLAVLAVLFVLLAQRALAHMEYLARRDGRLTTRGQ